MANLTILRNPAEEALIQRFPDAKAKLSGAVVDLARERAFASLREKGLPHRRIETYKYTDLRALMREAAPLSPEPAGETGASALLADGPTLSFVNGWFRGASEVPTGVSVTCLKDALVARDPLVESWYGKASKLAGDDAIVALNAAFVSDGVVVHVRRDIDAPLLFDFAIETATPLSSYPRALIVVEAGAKVIFVEHVHGPKGVTSQANSLVEIVVGDEASVEHVRLDETGDAALSLSSLALWLGREAYFSSFNMAVNPAASRYQVFATFAGRDAKASIRGATLLRASQHADATLLVDHVEPGGESRELFRTVLDGRATGVFQGKIIVRQKAQKTDGRMASNALMLSDDATMNNKPELEIFADDVQCAHGATCGALDDQLLFYLMARGIPRKQAEALMIESFVGETIEPIGHEGLRDALAARVEDWLKARV